MKTTTTISSFYALSFALAAALLAGCIGPASNLTHPPAAPASTSRTPTHLPLAFEPNVGQAAAGVRFAARAGRATIGFEAHAVSMRTGSTDVRIAFEGARAGSGPAGTRPLPGVINFFSGDDPSQWRSGVPTFGELVYGQLYPGIDLHYAGSSVGLKGTYTLAPGADPALIRWKYVGSDRVALDAVSGDLHIDVGAERFIEHGPVAWQIIGHSRVSVDAKFSLSRDGGVSFALGLYDPAFALIIDPDLVWATYLGGAGAEDGGSVATDAAGNVYVAGTTNSTNFPGAGGQVPASANIVVSKLNTSATQILYSTYIGGSGSDSGIAIAVNAAGEAIVTGDTSSANFPALNALFLSKPTTRSNAVLLRLSATGALLNSTFLPLETFAFEVRRNVALDGGGNVYVTGQSAAQDFGDVIRLLRLNPSLTAVTLDREYGGPARVTVMALAVSPAGGAYFTGIVDANHDAFPITSNAVQPKCGSKSYGLNADFCTGADAFVLTTAPSGDMTYASFLGGSVADEGHTVGVAANGDILVAGITSSKRFPTQAAFQPACPSGPDLAPSLEEYCRSQSGFVTRITASGNTFVFSTFYGATDQDDATTALNGLAVDASGNASVIGWTRGDSLPVKDAPQPSSGGGVCSAGTSVRSCSDAAVAAFTPAGGLIYSTFLGGSSDDTGVSIALDAQGNALVAGETRSLNFPVTASIVQPVKGGSDDFFITKIGLSSTPPPNLNPRAHLPIVIR